MCEEEEKLANLGYSQCVEFLQFPKGMIEMPQNARIPKATVDQGTAAILAFIQDKLLAPYAERWYFWPDFDNVEPNMKDTAYEDTVLSYTDVDPGAYRWRIFISQGMCMHKRMFTHRRKNGRILLIDKAGKAQGTQFDNGDITGLSIQLLNPENIRFTDGASVSTASPLMLALRDTYEINKYGVLLNINTSELYRISDVGLVQVGATGAALIVVDVKTACDKLPLSGLAADGSDFLLLDNDNGAVHAITSSVENVNIPGRYNLVGVAFEASKLSLKAPSLLSIQAYESDVIAIAAP